MPSVGVGIDPVHHVLAIGGRHLRDIGELGQQFGQLPLPRGEVLFVLRDFLQRLTLDVVQINVDLAESRQLVGVRLEVEDVGQLRDERLGQVALLTLLFAEDIEDLVGYVDLVLFPILDDLAHDRQAQSDALDLHLRSWVDDIELVLRHRGQLPMLQHPGLVAHQRKH